MPTSQSTECLWLDALQRMAGRAAHELRGALNGVSVNLEVVRSRMAKPDAAATSVAKYANAASDQLGTVIAMSEALLSLTRAVRGPVEIGATTRRIETLLAPPLRAEGRSFAADASVDEFGVTTADGTAARLVIAASLLAAIDASGRVVCRASDGDGGAWAGGAGERRLRVEACDGASFELAAPVLLAVSEAGIDVQAEAAAVSIGFPREQKDGRA